MQRLRSTTVAQSIHPFRRNAFIQASTTVDLDLDLTLSHGRLRAYFYGWIDDPLCRDIHRRRGARHADADGGYPVFDALRVRVHLARVARLERGW